MNGKLLSQVLDKMMVSPSAQNARVQVCLPDGKFYDVKAESWNMGKVLKKIGD